jgi:hypothetical protein
MPWPLYTQEKTLQYPLDTRLDGIQSQSLHGVEEKNSQPPPGIELRSKTYQKLVTVFRTATFQYSHHFTKLDHFCRRQILRGRKTFDLFMKT